MRTKKRPPHFLIPSKNCQASNFQWNLSRWVSSAKIHRLYSFNGLWLWLEGPGLDLSWKVDDSTAWNCSALIFLNKQESRNFALNLNSKKRGLKPICCLENLFKKFTMIKAWSSSNALLLEHWKLFKSPTVIRPTFYNVEHSSSHLLED